MMKFAMTAISALFCLSACATSTTPPADPPEQQAGIVKTLPNDEILQQEVVINASLGEAWDAFTTAEGYTAWASPFAHFDFRVGGHIESSYELDGALGKPGNIRLGIVAYLPQEMLVLKTVQAPPGFASKATLERLVSVFQFEAVNDAQTRVVVSGIGYGDDEESQRLRSFFVEGNAWSLNALHERFETGPADWDTLFAARQTTE